VIIQFLRPSRFDLQGDSVNKFNKATLSELAEAVARIKGDTGVKGLLVTSGKDCFIVGADVTEFLDVFQLPEDE
jgi:3-hydroxyacyl-CoA dehydrogenase / enoyl-CoA hydratase / 3-hydroxybutyryl-CoA epimerase / enoyl-CoA isomerase